MSLEQQRNLVTLGLTEGEAKTYIALMELGPSSAGPIVKKSGDAYSNIYSVLECLIEKGLVSFIIKNKTRQFHAVNPSNLSRYLEKKEQEIAEQKRELQKMLPQLKALQDILPSQEAEVFLGTKGLRTAYEKLVEHSSKKNPNLFFYIHDSVYGARADRFYFSIMDLVNKSWVRGISNELGRTSTFLKTGKYMQLRYVTFPVPGNIEVCGDNVIIVSWEDPIIAILIHSKQVAGHFRNYFESVWKVAKQ